MKTIRRLLTTVPLLASLLAGNAWADRPDHRHHRDHHRDGVRFSISIGTPWPAPPYRPYHPYPAYWPHILVPPVVPVIVTPQRIHVEQMPPASTVPLLEPGYWYYCNEAQAYYPYVQQCPGNWVKVAPQTR